MEVLNELVLLLAITVVVVYLATKLRIPPVVGFLLAGIICGPYGLNIVSKEGGTIELLSEIGVVMLLFTIGMEFSLGDLVRIRRYVLVGGAIQVLLTIALIAILRVLGVDTIEQGIFFGFLVSLSSTAIVMKVLQGRDEVGSTHGKLILAILVFQDLIVVPMMLITPILGGASSNILLEVGGLLLKTGGVILVTYISARFVVPRLLYAVTKLRSREIFLLTIIVICFAVAYLTSSIGLSLALGAFLAGLIISESEYSHQALSIVMPFRDVFTSLFFISIGMLFDTSILLEQPIPILTQSLGIILIKGLVATATASLLGFPLRIGFIVGAALAQVGEFSFILSQTGLEYNLLSENTYNQFLGVSVLSMALSPFLIPLGVDLGERVGALSLPKFLRGRLSAYSTVPDDQHYTHLSDHIIIIGYGVTGKNLARAASQAGVGYVVVELNSRTVKSAHADGEKILYGDATQAALLEHVGIMRARMVVVAIPDPVAARMIVSLARSVNKAIYILVRTRYVTEAEELYTLGANEVVPEEFETSLEIFSRVLAKYLIPSDQIDDMVSNARAEGYRVLRSSAQPTLNFHDVSQHLTHMDLSTLQVTEGSPIVRKSLSELDLRNTYKVTLLAILRGNDTITNPGGDSFLLAGDRVITFGNADAVFTFSRDLLSTKSKPILGFKVRPGKNVN